MQIDARVHDANIVVDSGTSQGIVHGVRYLLKGRFMLVGAIQAPLVQLQRHAPGVVAHVGMQLALVFRRQAGTVDIADHTGHDILPGLRIEPAIGLFAVYLGRV